MNFTTLLRQQFQGVIALTYNQDRKRIQNGWWSRETRKWK